MNVSIRSLVIPVTVVVLIAAAVVFASAGLNNQTILAYIRFTSGSSLLLFAFAWSASSLNQLMKSGVWRPVLRARRRIGLAFAVSHSFHLLGIITLYEVVDERRWSDFQALPGALIYAVIYAMALTSNDFSMRQLGRSWKRLHVTGGYLLWGAFTFSYLGKIGEFGALQHYLYSALCLALLAVRVLAWQLSRQRQPVTS